ncbi:phage tail protein [Solimicrobium silvestre]|uniref:P2 phage tail completion protein R (GpR) n=1 Tax=Solimicrobium silvestre TaxID=2099400 RepID=A0A2S9GT37_9BURK|nr:phage tail protein [Solimicrobium silvestre]PRC90873.1 P2 phage tail completion protein R (GpR) [Solimicrobium silvestre]
MYKPPNLRQHLTNAIPDLKQNPDKLLIFADQGHTVASGTGSLSFEYQYRLNIIITDFSGDPDAIMVPLLAWITVHQIELLANPDLRKKGIGFEVDFNNHETIDISIALNLTERTIVKQQDGGKLQITHPPEPQTTPAFDDAFWTLYAGDSLLAEWVTPT